MKILSIRALRGPNFWSNLVPKLIQVRLEVEEQVEMKEWADKLQLHFPNLTIDASKVGNVQAADLFAQLALVLEKKAGMKVGFWNIKPTIYPNICNLVFEYETEQTGKLTAEYAEKLLNSISSNIEFPIELVIEEIRNKHQQELPSMEIRNILSVAKLKNIPVLKATDGQKWQLGYGKNGVLITDDFDIELLSKNIIWRIPLIAVTGSNGKTTTTRLIAHIIQNSGKTVGFTTSDGIYINHNMIDKGDTTGPMSAEIVLRNPKVEVAVLESARGGIVRAGLGFDECDIAVVTNVQDDHLGISDIETMDDLAQVKGVVFNAVKNGGCAVLNAENIYTLKMGENAKCEVAWFAMNANNAQISSSKNAAYFENGNVVLKNGNEKINVAHVNDIPITFNGTVSFMIQNVLAATLASFIHGVSVTDITKSLKTFKPSAEQTPGRMNIFNIGNKKLLVDFAHNPDGFAGIRDFLASFDSPCKIGIIVGTGDRKETDLIEIGKVSAQMFDKIYIHQVKFLRGMTAEKIVELISEGILEQKPDAVWERISDEKEPLAYALAYAPAGSFITALSDVLDEPENLVEKYSK